ncbi:hypothetical protein [Novosphingobium resinovorum]|uniref:Uncharacterized protein n=1 Tax=Novosphingobium resinovorum TaxID=158500 RepID=A0A1D8A306_9SPHN|nr:hypothetical protein [Novosphingobium resinovorum]AOR76446.1 hypothetical protein BES08_06550 [Novosphingobium resinovorum]
MLHILALALATAPAITAAEVGVTRAASVTEHNKPATFELAGFRLGMSEAEVEGVMKSRGLKVRRAIRVTGFEDQVRGLIRARDGRAPEKGQSVLGEAEFDDMKGGRILLKLLAWPDAARISTITYLPPRGMDAQEWRRLLFEKYGPAADSGGSIDSEGLHGRWCGLASCSGAFTAFTLSADVSQNGGSIHLKQPDGTNSRRAKLIEAEGARRQSRQDPAF